MNTKVIICHYDINFQSVPRVAVKEQMSFSIKIPDNKRKSHLKNNQVTRKFCIKADSLVFNGSYWIDQRLDGSKMQNRSLPNPNLTSVSPRN